MTITEFLLARIAEDETVAQSAIDLYMPDAWGNPASSGNYYPADIAFWDSQTPGRVLAECAAKRAILAECRPGTLDDLDSGEDYQPAPMWVARALAFVYKDHPDYRQEWARG